MKEKQIEEMEKDLIEMFDEEYEKRRFITPRNIAEKMVAKCYRKQRDLYFIEEGKPPVLIETSENKQREGEWVHSDKAKHWLWKDECNKCHYHTHDREDLSHFNFCPSCGARMKGEGNGTSNSV